MASTYPQDSYAEPSFIDPRDAPDAFADQFDVSDPSTAASTYAKEMHKHTMRQMKLAKDSASRRGSTSTTTSSLTSHSSEGSMDESL